MDLLLHIALAALLLVIPSSIILVVASFSPSLVLPSPLKYRIISSRQKEDPSLLFSSSSTKQAEPPPHVTYDHDAWLNGFKTCENEECYELQFDEPLPYDFPSGTFYQNGPAKFDFVLNKGGDNDGDNQNQEKEQILHPFDGDGMVRAITFNNNDNNNKSCWYRNRFVRTPGFLEERRQNRICYRGVFGTRKVSTSFPNFFDLRIKNVANTHVLMMHNSKLYALWDAGKPIELNPITLETLPGTIENDILYGNRYSAHYKVDPQQQPSTICSFCIYFCWPDPNQAHKLEIMEHTNVENIGDQKDDALQQRQSSDTHTELLYKRSYVLPGLAVGHDMAITGKYFVFLRSPNHIKFNPLPFVLGEKGPAQCFTWTDQDDQNNNIAHLHLIPRGAQQQQQDPIITIDTPPCFCFHLCNAYEEEEDIDKNIVVVDAVVSDRMYMADTEPGNNEQQRRRPIWETTDFANDVPPFRLTRYRVDVKNRKLLSEPTNLIPHNVAATIDFPVIHPKYVAREYKHAYVSACVNPQTPSPLQGILKVNVQDGECVDRWMPFPHEFLSEVVLAPKHKHNDDGNGKIEKEDDVYLIGYLIDGKAQTTSVVVFDATCISKGPIAKAKLHEKTGCLPHPLHGTFVSGYNPEFTTDVQTQFYEYS